MLHGWMMVLYCMLYVGGHSGKRPGTPSLLQQEALQEAGEAGAAKSSRAARRCRISQSCEPLIAANYRII
jgi:hypothetical protein